MSDGERVTISVADADEVTLEEAQALLIQECRDLLLEIRNALRPPPDEVETCPTCGAHNVQKVLHENEIMCGSGSCLRWLNEAETEGFRRHFLVTCGGCGHRWVEEAG